MSVWEAALIVVAGLAAGAMNSVVGSGSLITFPTLLFLAIPPVTANMSNNVGLVPGALAASWGYRREITSVPAMTLAYVVVGAVGAVVGASLLLVLPASAFSAVAPVLMGVGVLLVMVGPWWQRRVQARRRVKPSRGTPGPWAMVGMGAACVYGGYFGAGQGVIQMGLLSATSAERVQVLTGVKNAVGLVVNAVAAVVFVTINAGAINWWVVVLIGLGSTLGGWLGARVGRNVPPVVLRALIVTIGVTGMVFAVVNR